VFKDYSSLLGADLSDDSSMKFDYSTSFVSY